MQIIKLPHLFVPRHYQRDTFDAYFNQGKRRIIQVLHRRAGKDLGSLNLMIAASQQRVGLYLYLYPEKTQARTAIWYGIDKDGVRFLDRIPPELIAKKSDSEMRILFKNGSVFQIGGSDRYDAYRGTNPIFIVFSEYSQQDPNAWDTFRPILTENRGVAFFNYTPFGQNHGFDLYDKNKNNPDWFVHLLTVGDTHNDDGSRIITEAMIEEERRSGMSEHKIQQEYYCDWYAAIPGAYYGDEMARVDREGRIKVFDIEKKFPVHTAWDLGVRDATAIWFYQLIGQEIRVIKYYENRNLGLDHYVNLLFNYKKEKEIFYGSHWAPHDIQVRELGSGKSRLEMAASLGLSFKIVPRLPVADGIDAVRKMFPKVWFLLGETDNGLSALRTYSTEYNEKKKIYSDKPLHDWSSNGSDAFRYLAVSRLSNDSNILMRRDTDWVY